ncbi:MAG TPA: sigma-E factor negative regulatory protein [Acidiferrobacter sp.]|nr:sigma-E factor negative regulatory protein [Acidiferrobacter sp.]
MKETLSALLDAELKEKDRSKILGSAVEDVELRRTWGRYHVARAVLRKEWDGSLSARFSDRVMAAIADEPSCAETPRLRLIKGQRGRQVVRFALAASLTAVAALFGLRMTVLSEPTPIEAPAKTTLAAASLISPQPYIERAHWQDPHWRNRVDGFLLERANATALTSLDGLSYVRLATYNNPPLRGSQNRR